MTHKQSFLLLLVTVVLWTYSCNKQAIEPEDTKTLSTTLTSTTTTTTLAPDRTVFNENIGSPMLRKEAEVWKARYQTLYSLFAAPYRVKADYIKTLLQYKKGIVCIAFYFITTEQGEDIVPIPVDKHGYLVKVENLTTATGQLLTWADVKTLREKYSGATKALIYGKNTFKRLIEEHGAESILLERAINDKDEETLILSNEATFTSIEVEDNGAICPTACAMDAITE